MPLPIGPFPYILTNGTLADANQVMADFNLLLNGINSLAPLAQVIAGGTTNVSAGLGTAGSSITVTAESVIVATALNGTPYTLTSFSQTFNGATTGPGGMDTGTLPVSGFVALYAIYNPTAPAISILGKSAVTNAPTIYNGVNMPAGYTASALLAIIPTNATPALVAGFVRNRNWTYQTGAIVLNGSSTNQPSSTPISIPTVVPPSAVTLNGGYVFLTTTPSFGAGVGLQLTINTSSVTGSTMHQLSIAGQAATNACSFAYGAVPITTPQTMYYQTAGLNANSQASLDVSGYSW